MVSQQNSNFIYEELRDSIRTTASLIQNLMTEIKNNEVSTATLETRLEAIDQNVQMLTRIVRDGNGTKSVITRLALIEDAVKDLFDRDTEFRKFVYSKFKEEQDQVDREEWTRRNEQRARVKYDRSKILTMLKIVPGVVSLIVVLIELVLKRL